MTNGRFIAVDWGTTNRRFFVIEDGAVASTARDSGGVLSFAQDEFDVEIARLCADYPGAPLVLAGMIGSNRGWRDAGYVAAPVGLAQIADGLVVPDPVRFAQVRIVPGVRSEPSARADVMRGEEVQLLGAVAMGAAPPNALLCQPGTHCKWARMQDGKLAGFTTAMTGEMFALLKAHSLIGSEISGEAKVDASFIAGVAQSMDADLLGALFGVRASSVLGDRAPGAAASFVSGLLIGSDCRARLPEPGATVYLLADGYLADAYSAAIAEMGCTAIVIDSHAAFAAGITAIWNLAK